MNTLPRVGQVYVKAWLPSVITITAVHEKTESEGACFEFKGGKGKYDVMMLDYYTLKSE